MADATVKEGGSISSRGSEAMWLWAAMLIAISPTISDLAIHWAQHPWSRYSMVFVGCYVLALSAESPGPPRRWWGLTLLATGLVGQLLSLLASMAFVARPFAAFSIIGVSFLRGRTSLRVALLALAIVPVPSAFLRNLGGVQLEDLIYRIAIAMLSPLDMSLGIEGRWVLGDGIRIRVDAIDGFAVLAIHMVFLAYYLALRRGFSALGTAKLMASWALMAVPIQVAVDASNLLIVANENPLGVADVIYTLRWLAPTLAAMFIEVRRTRNTRG